jgi:hypothetical protein
LQKITSALANKREQVMAARSPFWFGFWAFGIFRLFFPAFFIFTIGVAATFASQTTEYGFFDAPEFASSTGTSYSDLQRTLTLDGGAIYGYGYSTRFSGSYTTTGRAAWIVNAGIGNSSVIRVGLTGDGFTKTYGSAIGSQASSVLGMNAAGQFYGNSTEYHEGDGSVGTALWVATVTNPTAQRIGLFNDNEFTNNAGNHNSQVASKFALAANGCLAGYSTRYNGSALTRGQGAWVASAATGVTFRIGLYDSSGNEFTASDGSQNTVLRTDALGQQAWNNWGALLGTTIRYNGQAAAVGSDALWIANIHTGNTARLGLHDVANIDTISGSTILPNTYTAQNGANDSQLTGHTNSGILWGNTLIYNGGTVATGQTAWLFDTPNFTQHDFHLSTAANGDSFSVIDQARDDGIAFGHFTAYDDLALDTTLSTNRAFLWDANLGTQIMDFSLMDSSNPFHDFMTSQDCAYLTAITDITGNLNDLNSVIIHGSGYDLLGMQQLFELQLIPEPSTWLLLSLGLGSLIFIRSRKTQTKQTICTKK